MMNDIDKILKKKRYQGIVRWFGEEGWGFISSKSVDAEVYARVDDMLGEGYRTLEAGEAVEFRLLRTPRGLMAKEIMVVID